jgi:hypothetical protein
MAETTELLGLSSQQLAFFETFGFITIRGLFTEDMPRITRGFEEVFGDHPPVETREWLHFEDRRQIIPSFVDKSDDLRWLKDDPRVVGLISSIMRERPWEYAESDGNLFYCDSSWHPDIYAAPMTQYHVKLSFYLDPLRADTGAIRMLPGSNHHLTPYANTLLRTLQKPDDIEATYGVPVDQIPSWPLETDPGDLVIWQFRTIHASFGGSARRRLFSMNYREIVDDEG